MIKIGLYEWKPQFKVGDAVTSITFENEQKGRIIEILNDRGARGDIVYKVQTEDGKLHKIEENLLDRDEKEERDECSKAIIEQEENLYGVSKEERKNLVEIKTKEAIKFLKIMQPQNRLGELRNALKVQKYIALNNSYNPKIMHEKKITLLENGYLNELYNGLVRRQGVCTTDAIVFKHILSQVGMKSEVVILNDENGEVHAANLVEIGGANYFFDTTLQREFNIKAGTKEDEYIFTGAGFGIDDYSKYYKIQGVLAEDVFDDIKELPNNISKESLKSDLVEQMGQTIGNVIMGTTQADDGAR